MRTDLHRHPRQHYCAGQSRPRAPKWSSRSPRPNRRPAQRAFTRTMFDAGAARGGRPPRRRGQAARRPGRVGQGPVRRRRPADRRPARACWPTRPPPQPTRPPSPACGRPAAPCIGRTNMTEFAFSGVGINPHHGTPANPARRRPTPRIPGGSSSGAAVSVATGAAFIGLGSDTGGSIRIPAALKRHRRLQEHRAAGADDGAVPLSTTLDTVCAMTRSVRDAVAAARDPGRAHASRRGTRPLRALSPCGGRGRCMLDGLDPTVARAFERTPAAPCATPAPGSRKSRCRNSRPRPHQRHRRLRRGRELCLAPPAAGTQRRAATTPASRCASDGRRR